MPENTVRSFEFAGAGAGPWVPASSSMRVQSSVGVTVHAVTLIGQTPVDLGTVSAGSSGEFSTTHAFVRIVSAGAGAASIAASMPVSTGSGGGGTADTTEATQLLVRAAVQASAAAAGAPADAAASSDSASATQVSIAKRHNVLLSALLATPSDIVLDSAGVPFSPASCSHAYGYTDGNLTTDTATNGAVVRVKILTYTSGNLTSETKWVVQ